MLLQLYIVVVGCWKYVIFVTLLMIDPTVLHHIISPTRLQQRWKPVGFTGAV